MLLSNRFFARTLLAAATLAGPVTQQLIHGQAFQGSIVGAITDASAAAMTGATVTLINLGTQERRQAQTAQDGFYQFLNLVPGAYRITVEMQGFKRAVREPIEVSVSSAMRADVAMEIGDVNQSVEVEALAPLLNTESSNLSQTVSSRAVQDLPVNGRNILNLMALVPGVVPQGNTEGNALTGKNVFAAGNYQVGGGMANQAASYFDGVPMNAGIGNLTILAPSPDVVSDFRVQTNSNNAEFGRYSGGVLNLGSKSGTNQFHGSVYEFFRNRVLNASNFFANANRLAKPAFSQNQFGGTFGGPVLKDRLFFFAGYEGYRQRQGATFLTTVPQPRMNSGDFSEFRNASGALIPVFDPLTQCGAHSNPACAAGTGPQRSQFPGNVIPASRINPVSRRLNEFPLHAPPNLPGAAFTNLFNYSKNISSGGDNDQYNGRVDYAINERMRLFGRFTRWGSANSPAILFDNGVFGGDPFSPETFTTKQAVAGFTWLIRPTMILDLRASYGRWNYERISPFRGIDMTERFGFPSYFRTLPQLRQVAGETGYPQITLSTYTHTNPGPFNGHLFSVDNTYVLLPSFTWVNGRHQWKFGADLRNFRNNYYQLAPGGAFQFDNVFTSQNALNPGATGNALASFLLGMGQGGNMLVLGLPYQSLSYQGYYAQDTWQFNSKLTVTLGLRWEIPGVFKERYDRTTSLNPVAENPATRGILVNGRPVVGRLDRVNTPDHSIRGNKDESYRLFAPRLGIAYRIRPQTVFRAGAGMYYLPTNLQFNEGPYGNALNAYSTPWLVSIDRSVTPLNTLSDPFPGGFVPSLGSQPDFQRLLLGQSPAAALRNSPRPYQGQWNAAIQHQAPGDIAVELAYAASRGVHLPRNDYNMNAIQDEFLSLGSRLNSQVPNPFFGLVNVGALSQRTVTQGQLLLRYPQYTGFIQRTSYLGNTTYHSLQMKVERRFGAGGSLLGAYTFSKLLTDMDRDFHFGSPGPRQYTPTPHSRAGFDQNPLSEGGPVPADGFFRPS
ncbi:MAG: TonB-dependent receptor, partial [Acidobacteria bacterium]|nr:TonB-dependent receptor [Acidobacteriota bacterium]